MKKGDKVECISLEGFAEDPENYMIADDIEIGKTYTIEEYNDSYAQVDEPYIELVGHEFAHPASSFKLVE